MSLSDGHRLSDAERKSIATVLANGAPVLLLVWGEGDGRNVSFYAEGTRLEARIAYPEGEQTVNR